MKYLEYVDLTYMLQPHGWSDFYIFMDGAIYSMSPTHIFDDPMDVMLKGFSRIIQGEDEVSFTWHDEPGEYLWRLARNPDQRHKVRISITNCNRVDASRDPSKIFEDIEFEVKLKLFCICILKQMQKVQALMGEKIFCQTRGNFPHVSFEEFQAAFEQECLSRRSFVDPINGSGNPRCSASK